MRYAELLNAARQSRLYYPLKGLVSLRARELGARMRLLGRVGLEPPNPLELFLRVTFRCNLRCKMCGQWGDSGRSRAFDNQRLRQALDVRALERLAGELQGGPFPLVNIEGGEALLHREIEAMVTMLRGRGLHVKIVTNGVLLERHAGWLVRQGVAALSVSIDGSAGLHDEIRGVPGTYDKVLAGLRALRDEKRRQRSHLPLVQIATTMTRHNFGAMERHCDDLGREDLGIAVVMLKHPIFIPEAYVHRHEALVRREYGAEAPSARGFLDDYTGFDLAPLRHDLERVTARTYPFEVVILPRIPPAESARYYDYAQRVTPTRCSVPWMSPTIEPDGEVYPCNEFPDVSMGNINTQGWQEIWHGEPYRRFRKLLLRGLLPICHRCCQLTGA